MKYDFVAVGDITTDAFILLKDASVNCEINTDTCMLCMRFGDKIPYEKVDVVKGVGNAANAAVAAARLGIKTALVTDIGTDRHGDECLEVWRREGIADEFVRRHSEYPTHYHYVLSYEAERTILINHQPWPYVVPQFNETPEWIYFSSVGEHGESYHHELAAYVKSSGAKLAFQPGTFQMSLGAEKLADLYEATELFFCNKEEAQRILKSDIDDVPELIRGIHTLGPRQVVITDGRNGGHSSDGTNIWFLPMYPDPKPPLERTGAGDATSSTTTAFVAEGLSLPEALMRGMINAMSVVQEIGAQKGLLTKKDIEGLLSKAPEDFTPKKIS